MASYQFSSAKRVESVAQSLEEDISDKEFTKLTSTDFYQSDDEIAYRTPVGGYYMKKVWLSPKADWKVVGDLISEFNRILPEGYHALIPSENGRREYVGIYRIFKSDQVDEELLSAMENVGEYTEAFRTMVWAFGQGPATK